MISTHTKKQLQNTKEKKRGKWNKIDMIIKMIQRRKEEEKREKINILEVSDNTHGCMVSFERTYEMT